MEVWLPVIISVNPLYAATQRNRAESTNVRFPSVNVLGNALLSVTTRRRFLSDGIGPAPGTFRQGLMPSGERGSWDSSGIPFFLW